MKIAALLLLALTVPATAQQTPLAARYQALLAQCLEDYLHDGSNPAMARYAGSRNLSMRCDCAAEFAARAAETTTPKAWAEHKRQCEVLERHLANPHDPPQGR